MSKQETKTTKAKEPKESKTKETKTKVIDETPKDPILETKEDTGANENQKPTKGTQEEKEPLKSNETESNENKSEDDVTGSEEIPQEEDGMTYEEAEKEMSLGECIKLPEWKGFWFKSMVEEKVYVLLADGNIVDTPNEEYKERKDWIKVEPTTEQSEILDIFFKDLEVSRSAKEQNEKYMGLKAIAYNKAKNTTFHKLKKNISITELLEKKNLPIDHSRTSEFMMDNGQIFDLESNQLTNKK